MALQSRKAIQVAHEAAVLAATVAEHNRRHGLKLGVVSQPSTPDAILSDGTFTTWLEITDAFHSPEWAQSLSSHNSIKGHVPMKSGLYSDPDGALASSACERLLHKATKASYGAVICQYGPGILVVNLQSPWLNDDSLVVLHEEWCKRGSPSVAGTFAHVYIRCGSESGAPVLPWPGT
ncbi:hypothetical protein [Acidovorax sp. sic0104]|uniref:hypothetical protein n=1 Tax=Acidovorax sp. sic0104 TaxID=2854784 RepID=UPI001C480515|nr:hypothetical protein [Acidovorax sp. sic0104]MBV7542039.1 hypothetical protein [Acidovorax sp. sic0104]